MPGTKEQGYNNLVMSIYLSQVYLDNLSAKERQTEQWKNAVMKERNLYAEMLQMSLPKGRTKGAGMVATKMMEQFPRIHHLEPLKNITPENYPEQGAKGYVNVGPPAAKAANTAAY